MNVPDGVPSPSSDAAFEHDGIRFHFREQGCGVPFFFQHGLGTDLGQPFALFRPQDGIRLLSFDCRAHGQTTPIGPHDKITLEHFADDLLALMDHLQIEKAVVGGISMGAAIALNFVLRHPERALGLVIVRPAWLDAPRAESAAIFKAIAGLLRLHGPEKGLELFQQSPVFQSAFARSPASAASLASQFLNPGARENVIRLEKIPLDCPCADRGLWRAIAVPVLVLAGAMDAIHPLEFGQALAREIPNAQFQELTPKAVNPQAHLEESQQFISEFLERLVKNCNPRPAPPV